MSAQTKQIILQTISLISLSLRFLRRSELGEILPHSRGLRFVCALRALLRPAHLW